MKTLRNPLLGITAGVLLLAGCSTGAATSDAPSASASPSVAPTAGATPRQGMGGGGVSGEIVLAQDGLLQVQDTQSQTAVRYTDSTTVSQQVTVALSDVTVGSCVVAIVGDDGTATSLRVTEPVDGACTTGFPGGGQGGGQFPGGGQTPPSGAPTAMPTDGSFPTAMPSGAPSGAPGGQGGFNGTFVTGSVTAVSATGLTVKTEDASTDVTVGTDTTITGTEAADASAIAVGLCLTAQGKADDSGGFDATSITLSTKGENGCSTRGFGGQRGNGGDNRNGGGNG